jgi:hypothetical protein
MRRGRTPRARHVTPEHRLPSSPEDESVPRADMSAIQACWPFRFSSESIRGGAPRQSGLRSRAAFALYEVLLGLLIFAIGIIALGRAVNNCMNASVLSTDDARVREILANRMVEIETTPGQPDKTKESKINTGFGIVKLVQKAAPQEMKEEDGTELTGIIRVTLTANWRRGGADQSKAIAFYVYRL